MHISFRLFGRQFLIKIVSMPIPDSETEGIDSRCADFKHVIFLDYDKIDFDYLIEELKWLQEEFKLSEFYVFDTGRAKGELRGYHAICLDKLPIHEVFKIVMHSSCEMAFKLAPNIFNEYKAWVLRTHAKAGRSKPAYLCTVPSRWHIHEQSSAHAAYLEKHYGVPVKLVNPDGLTEIGITKYRTFSAKR